MPILSYTSQVRWENSAPVNYWTPENPSNEYPRPNSGYSTNSYLLQSSLAFRKASFVKIRDITLGYTLPKEWTSKMMVQKLRIYCSLNNFITFTDFPNYDPKAMEVWTFHWRSKCCLASILVCNL